MFFKYSAIILLESKEQRLNRKYVGRGIIVWRQIMKYLIVGASHGGHEAALELLHKEPEAEVTILEQGNFISFMSCGMELYLTNRVIDDTSVRNFKPSDLEALGGVVKNNSQVVAINADDKTVHVKNTITGIETDKTYDKLILSTGVNPVQLPVPGYELKNVFLMRGHDWALKIKAKLEDPTVQNVVIVGAGYIGIEATEAFVDAGKHVTLIDTLPNVLGAYLNEEMSDQIKQRLQTNGVDVRMHEFVQAYIGDAGVLSEVETDLGSYTADLVIEAVGVKPNTDWLQGTVLLDQKGWIKTDPFLQTNLPDVYAIGDSIVPFSIPANKPMPIALATTARREAQYVVRNITSDNVNAKPFKGVVGTSALDVLGYSFATAGLNRTTADRAGVAMETAHYEDKRLPYFVSTQSGNGDIAVDLSYNPDTHQILGGAVLADGYDVTAHGNTLALAISQKLTLEDIAEADFFFQPGFDRQWSVLNLAAQHALGYGEFTR